MGVDRGKRHEGSAAEVKQRDSELEHVAQRAARPRLRVELLQRMHGLLLRRALRLVEGGDRRARLQQPLDHLRYVHVHVHAHVHAHVHVHLQRVSGIRAVCVRCICTRGHPRTRAVHVQVQVRMQRVWRHLSEALCREGVQGRVAAEGLGEV